MDCPVCAQKISADAKICPLCGMDLVGAELELQPNDTPVPITTYREKKPRLPLPTPKPSRMGQVVTLLILVGLGYGGWHLYQKYFTEPVAESLSKGIEPPRPPTSMLEESAKQAAAEEAASKQQQAQPPIRPLAQPDPKAVEQSLASLQEQCKTETDAINSLKQSLAAEKKKYHDASSVWSLLSSAYAKLVEGVTGDPELNAAVAHLEGLERNYVAPKTSYYRNGKSYVDNSNGNSQWIFEANEWDEKYNRAERHVGEAETYLLEKLNQISKIIDDPPRRWVNTDLWESRRGGIPHPNSNKPTVFLTRCNIAVWSYARNRIGPAVDQIKEKVNSLKKSPAIQAIQQQIDAKQKHLLELENTINKLRNP